MSSYDYYAVPQAEVPSVGPQFLYSRQQLMGYKGYRSDTRIGNWAEDEFRRDSELEAFQKKRASGQLLLTKLHAKVEAACTPAELSAMHDGGALHYGDTLCLQSMLTGTVLAANTDVTKPLAQLAYQVSGTALTEPVGRNALTLYRLRRDGSVDESEGGPVRYGEPVLLALRSYGGAPTLFIQTQTLGVPHIGKSQYSKRDEVTAVTMATSYCLWKFVHPEPNRQLPSEGTPVPAGEPVALQHLKTHLLLFTDLAKLKNIFGMESDVFAHLPRNTTLHDRALHALKVTVHAPDGAQWFPCVAGAPLRPQLEVSGQAALSATSVAPAGAAGGAQTRAAPLGASAGPSSGAPQPQQQPAAEPAAAAAATKPLEPAATADDDGSAAPPPVEYQAVLFGPGGSIPGYIGGPAGGGAPAVIVVQEWWGVTEEVLGHAARLAQAGYRVLVPDLYKGVRTAEVEEAHHLATNLDYPGAIAELAHAASTLRAEGAPRVGVMGFCMGGALAMGAAAACADIDAAVLFYGVNFGLFDPAAFRKPVQAHFGAHDTMEGLSDPETARALAHSLAHNEHASVHTYGRVGHAFMNESPAPFESFEARKAQMGMPPYDEGEARLAWSRVFDFFRAHL